MSRSKPPFFKQETRYSCAPACLRMVLSAYGVELDEARLRELSDCSPFGVEAFQLIEAARQIGFLGSRKYTLASLTDLTDLLSNKLFPIVYVDLWPLNGGVSGQYHALVVLSVAEGSIIVLDPLTGERTLSVAEFMSAWAEMRYFAIVIEE